MKSRAWSALLVSASIIASPSLADIKKGDKLQTLANLHPDMKRHLLYTLNYQLPGLIPVCSDVTVVKVSRKKLAFTYNGIEFEIDYEDFTEGAGVSFQQAVQNYLGPACDKEKMQSLDKVDQDGIRTGRPQEGMTREGVLFAMGRPPVHANPNLDATEWMYWKNRFAKMVIKFDASGKVSNIR